MKGKKPSKKVETIKTFNKFKDDTPVSIPMNFEDAIKKMANTPVKNSKTKKK